MINITVLVTFTAVLSAAFCWQCYYVEQNIYNRKWRSVSIPWFVLHFSESWCFIQVLLYVKSPI